MPYNYLHTFNSNIYYNFNNCYFLYNRKLSPGKLILLSTSKFRSPFFLIWNNVKFLKVLATTKNIHNWNLATLDRRVAAKLRACAKPNFLSEEVITIFFIQGTSSTRIHQWSPVKGLNSTIALRITVEDFLVETSIQVDVIFNHQFPLHCVITHLPPQKKRKKMLANWERKKFVYFDLLKLLILKKEWTGN